MELDGILGLDFLLSLVLARFIVRFNALPGSERFSPGSGRVDRLSQLVAKRKQRR